MPDDDNDQSDTDDNDQSDTSNAAADVVKWKRLARQHEARSKANKAELDKLRAEMDGASKSDVDKLQSTVDQLRNDLADERRKAMIAEIAAERGLTPVQARRLTGSTREEIESDADEIVEAFGIKPVKGQAEGGDGDELAGGKDDGTGGSRRPREQLRPGAASESLDDEVDARKIAESVLTF